MYICKGRLVQEKVNDKAKIITQEPNLAEKKIRSKKSSRLFILFIYCVLLFLLCVS